VGVFGSSLTSYGVAGQSTLASGAVSGVYGTVVASNTSGVGVAGAAYVGVQGTGTGAGVTGYSPSSGYGIQGISQSGDAVYGASNGNGNGLHGITAGAASGVYGVSTYTGGTSYGVYGSSPSYGVWGTSTGSSVGVVGSATGSGSGIYGQNSNSSGWSGYFNGYVNVATCLKVNGTNYGSCTSDARLKKNVEPLTGSLEKITRLRPVTFEWKEPDEHNGTGRQVGFIAQDVEKVLPEWVGANDKGFKTVNRGGLDVMLVDSVRTLKMENDDLRIRSASLEDRVRSLEAGRRPLISGMGEGGIGLGMLALAGALVFTKRKRTEV
jgi:hypothetical protein